MIEKFPIRQQDEERIKNDFRSIKVHCIRCGLEDIEISGVESQADGITVHGLYQPGNPHDDRERTFYVTGLLFCRRRNHRFHVKILDQGLRNTNVYFNNMLT